VVDDPMDVTALARAVVGAERVGVEIGTGFDMLGDDGFELVLPAISRTRLDVSGVDRTSDATESIDSEPPPRTNAAIARPHERGHRSEFEYELCDVVKHGNPSGFRLRAAFLWILRDARFVLRMARVDCRLRHRQQLGRQGVERLKR